ncbi:TPA: hypothetical protein NH024_001109 [Pseudomonas aeruginosa]|uniref:hypothetical protein n=1 Tax=Pseudomonas aeruginosa TaxID=287 RepID=UPI001ABF6C2D|nr:hypothetical protein [Pseudomonas aeruginosa]HCE9325934.1 hypothetical protein [Pseudomonas aeruginosa]HCE9445571.1 hypothetical protein [Pseudomonas aeruginosa]
MLALTGGIGRDQRGEGVQDFFWWLGVVSSIASIGSAIWAWKEAKDSAKAATKAEQIHSRMINHRHIAEANQVLFATRSALQSVSAIGPSCALRHMRGLDTRGISRHLEGYCQTLNEHSYLFSDALDNSALKLSTELLKEVTIIANSESLDDVKAAGSRAFLSINRFMPLIKDLSDERREKIK